MASFKELIKEVENSVRAGYKDGAWFPHKSVEGGTRTLGYGHKLSQQEEDGNYVVLPDGSIVDFSSRGLTEEEVDMLLEADLQKHKSIAATQWDNAQKTPFSSLNPMHQALLTEIAYNIGTLKKGNKWAWPSLAKGILNNDDEKIKAELMRSYTTPKGKRVELKERVNKIRSFFDEYNTSPNSVVLEGFGGPDDQSPEEPQRSYSKLVAGLASQQERLATPPQRQRETPSEPQSDPIDELTKLVEEDMSQEQIISRGERRLAQTYKQVTSPRNKEFSEEDEKKIQELMNMEGETVVLRETTNPTPVGKREPEEREDDPSKDPIYGLF